MDEQKRKVFLKTLQTGPNVTLYSYQDDKLKFFVFESGFLTELLYSEIRDGAAVRLVETYKNQLINVAVKHDVLTEKLKSMIKKSRYNEGLTRIAAAINGIDRLTKIREKGVAVYHNGFVLGAGLSIGNLGYHHKDYLSEHSKGNTSYAPYIAAGYNFYLNKDVGKFLMRADVVASTFDGKSTTYENRTSYHLEAHEAFKQTTLSPGLGLLYNLYNQEKLKFYLGAGARINLAWYKDQHASLIVFYPGAPEVRKQDPEAMEQIYLSAFARGGVVVRKKLEFSVLYQPNAPVIAHANYVQKAITLLQAGVHYHF